MRENARQRKEIEELRKQIGDLRKQLEEALRARKRQAAPFSKGAPVANPRKPGRKSGKRYGRKGHQQIPDRVDETIAVPLPAACDQCDSTSIKKGDVERCYEIDIPPVQTHVTCFEVECGTCERGHSVRGRHPRQISDGRGAAAVHLGPRALAIAGQLHQGLGLSYGKVAFVFREFFGLSVTRGGLSQALDRVGEKLTPTYSAMQSALQQASMVVPDETGWKVGGWLQWLWVFATTELVFYSVFGGRGFEEAAAVLGEDFSGRLVRDGWAPYDKFLEATHQTCLAHLFRRVASNIETADRGTARVPRAVQRILRNAISLRARRDRGDLRGHALAVARGRLEARTDQLLRWKPRDEENRKLLKHLRKQRHALFTFLDEPGIDATNWRAEQAIRPAVVARKVWGGNRTWNGATTHGILLTFLRTASQQRLDPAILLAPVLASRGPTIAGLRGLSRVN